MIRAEKLTYSFPSKDLYKNISFTIEDGQHCAFIGSNGTGKTTLVNIIMDTEDKYMYEGKLERDENARMGYVSQFAVREKGVASTVFDYLAEEFVRLQNRNEELCALMAEAENLDEVFEEYQKVLDEFDSMDGNNYESNIKKQLKLAGLAGKEELELSKLSGGEYKLLQVIKQMLRQPAILVMDEPDVFLDFENLNGLVKLINSYEGTLIVITHNRYLLNHCFNKILHLENMDIQEFDGSYIDYNFALLQKKIELQELAKADQEEIERYRKMVERMRLEATNVSTVSRGKAVNRKATHLARLEARQIKEPFVEIRQPKIKLPFVELMEEEQKSPLLIVENYNLSFEDELLNDVNFEINAHEKVAIVGPNGTGKTTMLREIFKNQNPAIRFSDEAKVGFVSQIHEDMLNESNTVYEEFEALGFENKAQIQKYLSKYCFAEETLNSKIEVLSGGEKNLLQIAKMERSEANLLLLDEPTSHLDTYSQTALEKAIQEYQGAVLMVSHDFYSIVNCADYILFVEDQAIRRMRVRSFRKMIYQNHFDKDYLELEQKKQELETRIGLCLKDSDFKTAKKLAEELETIIDKMQ